MFIFRGFVNSQLLVLFSWHLNFSQEEARVAEENASQDIEEFGGGLDECIFEESSPRVNRAPVPVSPPQAYSNEDDDGLDNFEEKNDAPPDVVSLQDVDVNNADDCHVADDGGCFFCPWYMFAVTSERYFCLYWCFCL